MSRLVRLFVVVVTGILAALGTAPSARASTVRLGDSLPPVNQLFICGAPCSMANLDLSEEGLLVQSPVSGAVVKWRIRGGKNLPGYALTVLKRGTGLSFTAMRSSDPATPAGAGIEPFSTNLRIEAGDYIGLNLPEEGRIGVHEGGTHVFFTPALADGVPATGIESSKAVEFNAEVQPEPAILLLSPGTGPITGGTTVTIAGMDFTDVTAVRFGNAPASSFTVESENRLTAVSPAAPGPGAVDVSVTTVAGTSPPTGVDRFEYTAAAIPPQCVAPNLKGKRLKAARKRAAKSKCRIGKVTKLEGTTAKSGKVVKQKPKAGKSAPAGTKIAVTLR
jgi:IPT/TIG domain/PASTA domain